MLGYLRGEPSRSGDEFVVVTLRSDSEVCKATAGSDLETLVVTPDEMPPVGGIVAHPRLRLDKQKGTNARIIRASFSVPVPGILPPILELLWNENRTNLIQ